jgi:hypothetical protein
VGRTTCAEIRRRRCSSFLGNSGPAANLIGIEDPRQLETHPRGDARWHIQRQAVVYGGEESQRRTAGQLIGWADLPDLDLG